MPAKDIKPKIKTEEIKDEDVEKGIEYDDSSNETDEPKKETTHDSSQPPKVSSFSQLDTKPIKDDTVKSQLSEKEENEPMDKPVTEVEEKPKTILEPEEPETKAGSEEPSKETKEVSSEDIKEWLQEVRPDTSKEQVKTGGPNFKIIIIVVLLLAILGAIVGGVVYYRKGVSQPKSEAPTPQPQVESPTPTPEPEEKVDLSTYSLSVLNGSGVKGEAAKVKGLLVEAGFSEENLKTGNADKTDYQKTTVSMKKDAPEEVFEAIKDALVDEYDIEQSETELDDDSSFDVIVIVGARKTSS